MNPCAGRTVRLWQDDAAAHAGGLENAGGEIAIGGRGGQQPAAESVRLAILIFNFGVFDSPVALVLTYLFHFLVPVPHMAARRIFQVNTF
jgi:hypothetical protein